MVGKKKIPEEFYDVKVLYPHFYDAKDDKEAKRQWLVKSAFTTSAVGLLNWARFYGKFNQS